ncbi:hypothetical protein [Nocardioides nanhaiensis]|uniref:Glycosyltransferase RgtA/B/C/D-like domain-containing protein n=1 Tax=Nocardioides nanhaiensis TaxID=1476871 RepID=A0ABP8W8Q1_9ACTN
MSATQVLGTDPVRPPVRRAATPGRGWGRVEALLTVALLGLYLGLGQWVVREVHVVGFTSLRRFADALHVVGEPLRAEQVLAADPTPLATVLTMPLTVVPGAVTSLAAVPVGSALAATGVVLALHRALGHASPGRLTHALLLLGIALNPLVLLYATSGDALLLAPALVLAAMACLDSYRRRGDLRALLLAGGALALASLADPRLVIVPLVLGAGIFLAQRRSRHPRVVAGAEGTLAALLSPTVALLALWAAVGTLLAGRPVAWLAAPGALRGPAGEGDLGAAEAWGQTVEALALAAPLVILVLVGLVVRSVRHHAPDAAVLAALLVTTCCLPALTAVVSGGAQVQVREAVLPLLVATAGAGLLLGRDATGRGGHAPKGRRLRRVAATGAVAVLLVTWPTTWHLMRTSEHQVLEAAFVRAVETGRSQEGALTPSGNRIGYGPEARTSRFLRDLDPGRRGVLVDPEVGYPVLVGTARPDWFRDHPGTAGWRAAALDPAAAGVRYLLLTADPASDRLAALHPLAAAGLDPSLRVVHRSERYVLVEPVAGAADGGWAP